MWGNNSILPFICREVLVIPSGCVGDVCVAFVSSQVVGREKGTRETIHFLRVKYVNFGGLPLP